jgi:hypothetical protein
MTDRMQYDESDPRHHTIKLKNMLTEVSAHAREDVGKINEPRGQALLETAVEVCDGLTRALEHYEGQSEQAWKR